MRIIRFPVGSGLRFEGGGAELVTCPFGVAFFLSGADILVKRLEELNPAAVRFIYLFEGLPPRGRGHRLKESEFDQEFQSGDIHGYRICYPYPYR
jgi:hypothetical protein